MDTERLRYNQAMITMMMDEMKDREKTLNHVLLQYCILTTSCHESNDSKRSRIFLLTKKYLFEKYSQLFLCSELNINPIN